MNKIIGGFLIFVGAVVAFIKDDIGPKPPAPTAPITPVPPVVPDEKTGN